MSCDSVLRVGPTHDNASAAFLRTALLAHFGETSSTTGSNEPQQEKDVLYVTNRYFEARVLLRELLGLDGNNSDSQDQATTYKEDGVILVFDALRSNPDLPIASSSSFDSLTAVHEQAERLGECGDLLRLCVGVSIGSMSALELRGKQHEEEYSRRVLWCLDRGYEYVEADLSAEGQKKGHDQRDKDGFARIVEAITGTMWSSAKMRGASPKALLKQSYEKESQSDVVTTKDDSSNPYVPPDDSMLPTQTESSDAPLDPQLAQPGDASKTIAGLMSEEDADASKDNQRETTDAGDKENGDPEELECRRQEKEQESLFEDLERVMGEAKKIRETSQSGTMSDDERRKRAGDAAMLMMGLMDKLDFDDDPDDVHVSSDEEEIEQNE